MAGNVIESNAGERCGFYEMQTRTAAAIGMAAGGLHQVNGP